MAGSQLRTVADWQNWVDYQNGSAASSAGIRRSAKGPVDQARRLVIRAYRRSAWGLPGGDFKGAAARLTAAGYPTTEQDFKNAARGELVEHVIPRDRVEGFITVVQAIWPSFEWQKLVLREPEHV